MERKLIRILIFTTFFYLSELQDVNISEVNNAHTKLIDIEQHNAEKTKIFYDYQTHVVAYKDVSESKCYVERMQLNQNFSQNSTNQGNLKTLYVYDSKLTKRQVYKLGGPRIVEFCRGFPTYLLQEITYENEINDINDDYKASKKYSHSRRKRTSQYYPPGRIGGQTQSQYLNFGNNGQGKAEAEASYGLSKAVVTGSSGMGQAQSQSNPYGCDDCYNQYSGYRGPDAVRQPVGPPSMNGVHKPNYGVNDLQPGQHTVQNGKIIPTDSPTGHIKPSQHDGSGYHQNGKPHTSDRYPDTSYPEQHHNGNEGIGNNGHSIHPSQANGGKHYGGDTLIHHPSSNGNKQNHYSGHHNGNGGINTNYRPNGYPSSNVDIHKSQVPDEQQIKHPSKEVNGGSNGGTSYQPSYTSDGDRNVGKRPDNNLNGYPSHGGDTYHYEPGNGQYPNNYGHTVPSSQQTPGGTFGGDLEGSYQLSNHRGQFEGTFEGKYNVDKKPSKYPIGPPNGQSYDREGNFYGSFHGHYDFGKTQGEIAGGGGNGLGRPGQRPGEGRPTEGGPGFGRPGEGGNGFGRPGQGPGFGRPGEGGPGFGRPGDAGPGFGRPGEGGAGFGRPGEGGNGFGRPGEGPGFGRPGEGGPGFGRPSEGGNGFGRPGEGPGFGRPGEGGPGFGRPGEGGPGFGRPGEGGPGFGRPGEGGNGFGRPGDGPGFGRPGEGGPGFGRPGESGPGFGGPSEDGNGFGRPGEGSGFGKPDEGGPGFGSPGEGRPGFGRPGEGGNGFGRPVEKPGFGRPGEGGPGFGRPGEGGNGFGKPGEGPGFGRPGEGGPGFGRPGEGGPGFGRPGEGPGFGRPGEGQGFGRPGEGGPGFGKPGEGGNGFGRPGERPDEGGPGYGRPGEGGPGFGRPGEGGDGFGRPGEEPGIGRPGEGGPGFGRPGEGPGFGRPGEGGPTNIQRPDENDDGTTQVQTSVQQTNNETQASATANGYYEGKSAQSQVSGVYSGSGSFSASAGTSDGKRGAHTQVSGGKWGGLSSAQGQGGIGQSQAQVELNSETGQTSSNAQTSGWNHGTNTQVEGGMKGGMADAQANGIGRTSSQAQIGFHPYDESEVESSETPYTGGGTAGAQSGAFSGQSQTQLQGRFYHGIRYVGSAQAGSGTSSNSGNQTQFGNLLLPTMKPLSKSNLLLNQVQVGNTLQNENNQAPNVKHSKKDKVNKNQAPATPSSTEESDEYEYDGDDEDDSYNAGKKITQSTRSQKQHIILDPLEDIDAVIMQVQGQPSVQEGTILQPGETVPGTHGYQVPKGFRGVIKSVAGGPYPQATGYNSQAQTVSFVPGRGEIIYKQPSYSVVSRTGSVNGKYSYGTGYTYQPKHYQLRAADSQPSFISSSKSETGVHTPIPGKTKLPIYYSQSSTCGFFTNSCVYNGNTKICMPKPKVNEDGSPIKC